jgi:hypothetical protein
MRKWLNPNLPKKSIELNNKNNAIVVIGFNRPEMLNQRLLDLAKLKGRRIYISIDFESVETTEKTKKTILESLQLLSVNNHVAITYHEKNLGLTEHVTKVISDTLNLHTNIIVIEDDIMLNENTIYSLDFGLELMNQDLSIGSVGAFSPLNIFKPLQNLNRFQRTKYFACWGWATTREKWAQYTADLSHFDIAGSLEFSRTWNSLSHSAQSTWLGRFRKVQINPKHTWDLQFQYASFRNDWTNLIPLGSLVGNIGFSDFRSVHTKGTKPRWMRQVTLASKPISLCTNQRLTAHFVEKLSSFTFVGDYGPRIMILRKLFNFFKGNRNL